MHYGSIELAETFESPNLTRLLSPVPVSVSISRVHSSMHHPHSLTPACISRSILFCLVHGLPTYGLQMRAETMEAETEKILPEGVDACKEGDMGAKSLLKVGVMVHLPFFHISFILSVLTLSHLSSINHRFSQPSSSFPTRSS